MPRKKEKKEKKHFKKNKVSAKATNNVHVEIHHHSKKRGKSAGAPRAPQFIPMGGGSTIVNNIPSPDFPNFQLMHQQASYENIIKNLAAEIQAIKLSAPGANQEVITSHAQEIKNEIDNTVKPTVKLNIPGTGDSPTKLATGAEDTTPQKTYNNDLFNDSPLDVGGFSPTFMNTPGASTSLSSTPSFSFSFPTPQSTRPNLSIGMTEPTTFNPIKQELSLQMIGQETYTPSPLDIANTEYNRIRTYNEEIKNPLLKRAALKYGRATDNTNLIQLANKVEVRGRSGYYPTLERTFAGNLNKDSKTAYGDN